MNVLTQEDIAQDLHERFAPDHAPHWEDLDDAQRAGSLWWDVAAVIGEREAAANRQKLPADLRADLTEFARDRIEAVWADAGGVPAQVLAENIVAAQEFAWLTHFTPIGGKA